MDAAVEPLGADVSRETLAVAAPAKTRCYRSPYRVEKAARTRAALIESALHFISAGNFRPTSKEITGWIGVHHGAVNYHFGALELMMRCVAREHWREVMGPLPFTMPTDAHARDAVWIVLVGKPTDQP